MANGADIAKAYVQIIPSADGIKGQLTELMGGEAEKAGKSSGGKLGKALGKGFAAAATGLATGTAAMGAAFAAATTQTAAYGDNIDKMSQKLGLSSTSFQRWDYVLSQSGADINSMGTGLKTLTNKLDDAKNGSSSAQEMFAKLGLSMDDLNNMSREEVFENVIYGFQGMADSTERAALANDIFGKSGQELTPLFNTSIEDTKAMIAATEEYGMVMSEDAVKASANFTDSLDTLKRTFGGLKNNLMTDFMPSITSVMDGLTKLMSGDSSGINDIKNGISAFIKHISDAAPQIFSAGAEILVSLAQAIVDNLPMLLQAAVQAIKTIAEGLLSPENIEALIQAAIEITIALMEGMVDALPLIIDATVTLISAICEKLGDPDTINRLLVAAWEIIKALAKGLWDALPQVVTAIGNVLNGLLTVIRQKLGEFLAKGKELVGKIGEGIRNAAANAAQWGRSVLDKIISGIRNALSTALSIGRNIVEGIWNGISNGLGWIKNKITGWVGNVMSFLKSLFGIKSPSTWARDEIGFNIAAGVGVGFEDGMKDVEKAMQASIPTVGDLMGNTNFAGAYNYGNLAPAYNYGGVTIQILGREKDAEQLAIELQNALVRRAAVWA